MRLLQIQTRVPCSEGDGAIVTTIPVKGSIPLIDGYEVKLWLNRLVIGFYLGRRGTHNDSRYYGNEYIFPEYLPGSIFSNFSLPVTEFFSFDQESITGLVQHLLLDFLRPEFQILGLDEKSLQVQFQCQSVSGDRFKTVVEIQRHRLKEYIK